MNNLRIAYIGCGAVVERSHLPALVGNPSMTATVLIDFNQSQRIKLADQYSIEHHGDSVDAFLQHFDVAVIATPSASHFALTKMLLDANKHVLVEKPLALDYSQACELVELANRKQKIVSVSLIRRYIPHYKLFKTLIAAGVVGEVQSFTYEEGAVFNWPVQGAGFYDQQVSGGGVLMDNGAHVLDACLWWFGDYASVEYKDDAQGGVEAECELMLTLANGAKGTVAMSRLRKLSNTINVVGDKGSINMDLANGEIKLNLTNEPIGLAGSADQKVDMTTVDLFKAQYSAINELITSKNNERSETELVLGADCLPSIRLIEECYANREALSYRVG